MMKRHFCLVLALCSLLIVDAHRAPAEKPPSKGRPIRALLICGGCCHDYKTQKDVVAKGISARADVQWTIAHEGDKREHKHSIYSRPDWWKGYDVIVHDECFGAVTDDAFIENIVKVHASGVPVVALHCAVHSYRMARTTAWSEMLGIRSLKHGPRKPISVSYLKPDHEITKGLADWTTPEGDELYNNIKVYDKATPLARGTQDDAEAVVVWTNDFHGTRVFCTTLGHTNGIVADARYLDLVTRGLLWAVGRPVDENFKTTTAAP
jgi:type 1 glutamine amidotransferase